MRRTLFAIALLGLPACSVFSRHAQPDDILKFSVVQQGETLHLRGVIRHSALGIQNVSVDRDGEIVHVEMYLMLAHRGATGNVNTDIDLHNVNVVELGDGSTIIWRRPQG